MDKLLPCPFCGSDEVEIKYYPTMRDAPYFWCECENCSAKGGEGYDYDKSVAVDKAVALWNRRD